MKMGILAPIGGMLLILLVVVLTTGIFGHG